MSPRTTSQSTLYLQIRQEAVAKEPEGKNPYGRNKGFESFRFGLFAQAVLTQRLSCCSAVKIGH